MADWKQIESLIRDAGIYHVMACDRVQDEPDRAQRLIKLATELHAAAKKNPALTPALVGQEGAFMELKAMATKLLSDGNQS